MKLSAPHVEALRKRAEAEKAAREAQMVPLARRAAQAQRTPEQQLEAERRAHTRAEIDRLALEDGGGWWNGVRS